MEKSVVQVANPNACCNRDRDNQVILKRNKTGTEMQMPFLPEEIIFKIFLLLPAKVLHDVMRLVCILWRKVVRNPVFTKAHLLQSPNNSPFGVVPFKDYFELYSINKDETIWNLTKRIDQKYVTHGVGLILIADRDDRYILYLLNPITKQIVTLPHAPIKYSGCSENWAVGYSPSTLKYKVVCADSSSKRAYILTVGVDKQWRETFDSMTALITHYRYFRPPEIWGFMYWSDDYNGCLIVFDLEKEIFYKVDFPEKLDGYWWMTRSATSISLDRILSIGIPHDCKGWQWHFLELVDFKNGGEWRKFGSIDLNYKLSEINKVMGLPRDTEIKKGIWPVAVMQCKDEVFFNHYDYNRFFAYNFKMGTVSRLFDNVPGRLRLMFTHTLVEL